ncbi:MAG: chemotaxis response regulator protein-glutamate methylesterase [Planctomycetes bacterium]|nr:chemotaxis response regulator protein-glutamate methylesterase [Planctomycetota bacterium]
MESAIRVLVVDDSALYRKFVSSVLNEIADIEVVGTARNGRIGLEKIESLKPDLVTLDLEMPEMDGLTMLRELSDRDHQVPTIVISSLTAEGAKSTNTALQLGAFDFVLKPVGKGPNESRQLLRESMAPKIEASLSLIRRNASKTRPSSKTRPAPVAKRAAVRGARSADAVAQMVRTVRSIRRQPKIVCIGVSTGGPVALNLLIPKLPQDFPCPILLVQHMPPMFTKSLADDLNRISALEVKEAEQDMIAQKGQVLIAPGGAQMRIVRQDGNPVVQITNDPPERNCKPSADYLFRSVAEHYGDRVLAAILTGMGDDGTIGCQLLKKAGARIIAQDEASCVVYGMSRSVIEAGIVDEEAPLQNIADCLMQSVGRGAIA